MFALTYRPSPPVCMHSNFDGPPPPTNIDTFLSNQKDFK